MENVTINIPRKNNKYWPSEVHLTPKVWRLPVPVLDRILIEINNLDCFSPHKGNKLVDSHGHVEAEGYKVFWRLEHLHTDYECASPNPYDNKKTARVLSIALASEVSPLIPRPQPIPNK